MSVHAWIWLFTWVRNFRLKKEVYNVEASDNCWYHRHNPCPSANFHPKYLSVFEKVAGYVPKKDGKGKITVYKELGWWLNKCLRNTYLWVSVSQMYTNKNTASSSFVILEVISLSHHCNIIVDLRYKWFKVRILTWN